VKAKLYKPTDEEINHFRESIKYPTGDVEREEPIPPRGLPPTQPPQGDGEIPTQEEGDPEENSDHDDIEDKLRSDIDKMQGSFAKVFKPTEGDFAKKVNFIALESQMTSQREKIMAELNPVITEIYRDLFSQIERKKIVEKRAVDRIDTLKVKNLSKVKRILKTNLLEQFKDAKKQGEQELFKNQTFRTPLPSDEFLKVLEAETFQFVGDWEFQVTRGARIALQEAVRDGKPLSSVIDLLEEDGVAASQVSLERFARTKLTDVMNRGRLEFFEESGVVAGYQYSAVLDERTTEICQGLHGKFFKSGTEPIPPLHFNCRSLLIPITKFEEFEPTTKIGSKSPDDFIEENKGAGFSKR